MCGGCGTPGRCCGDSSRGGNCTSFVSNRCSFGGCYLRRRDPHYCCRLPNPPCPLTCPPPPPRCPCTLPPVILPLSCYKPTAEGCAQEFIIHAVRTACRPKPQCCSDAPCGPKATVINFVVPNRYIPRIPRYDCKQDR